MDNERRRDLKKETREERGSLGTEELDRKRGSAKGRETVQWRQNKKGERGGSSGVM